MAHPVLFVFAHPDISRSRANKAFAGLARTIEGVEVYNLYARYPDLYVSGAEDREKLEGAAGIVLQFPIYWYAGPALLKEWIDRTFASGWAYGRGGAALRGKKLLISITTGSQSDAYGPEGVHSHPVNDYLKPYAQIARFCGMKWQRPLVFHHARGASDPALAKHRDQLRDRLEKLVASFE
jgi:putative NADPH-quinone reductase